MMKRRDFLLLSLAALPGAGALLHVDPALADDKDDDSGDDDSGDDDSGNDDSGNDDDGGNDDGGKDSADKGGEADDHVEARDAVRDGRILPLREILNRVKAMRAGRVLSVDLALGGRTPVYILKVENNTGSVRTLRLNAETGRALGPFAWW
ncbi:MAG: hypothetical protein K0M60_14100 [Hydrogenophaga sp.]|nr:hypothetical protein [Hydrogenophaga sp.]